MRMRMSKSVSMCMSFRRHGACPFQFPSVCCFYSSSFNISHNPIRLLLILRNGHVISNSPSHNHAPSQKAAPSHVFPDPQLHTSASCICSTEAMVFGSSPRSSASHLVAIARRMCASMGRVRKIAKSGSVVFKRPLQYVSMLQLAGRQYGIPKNPPRCNGALTTFLCPFSV